MAEFPELTTARLRLRAFVPADAPAVFDLFRREQVAYGWNCGTLAPGALIDGMGTTSGDVVPGLGTPLAWGVSRCVSQSEVRAPAATLLLTDIMPVDSYAMFTYWQNAPAQAWFPHAHQEGANCAYVDGHVKWQRADSLRGHPEWFTRAWD